MTRYDKAIEHAQAALSEAHADGLDAYAEAYRREEPFSTADGLPQIMVDLLNDAWFDGWDTARRREDTADRLAELGLTPTKRDTGAGV